MSGDADDQLKMLGDFLRTQRRLANLSLRQLSAMTAVSNPYLSQIERGLHAPSVRVLKSISEALNLSTEALLEQAGLLNATTATEDGATEAAVRADSRLTAQQQHALLCVYHSYIEANEAELRP